MNYTVSANDTIQGISEQFGISPNELMRYNNLSPSSPFFPGMVIIIPTPPFHPGPFPPSNFVYMVRRGDTLRSISRRFRVNPNTIMYMNGLSLPFVFPGQRLIIPVR